MFPFMLSLDGVMEDEKIFCLDALMWKWETKKEIKGRKLKWKSKVIYIGWEIVKMNIK